MTGREPNDIRDSLSIAAVALGRPDLAPWSIPEEAFWIAAAGEESDPASLHQNSTPPSSRTLADTGYVVMRERAGHAVFDAGMHGYLNGGHAHADALSLTLTLNGRPFLVDPGTSTYTMNPRLRDTMRGSLNHNTLSIDGRPQSIPDGPFHWKTMASAQLRASRHNPGFDWVEGTHSGYAPIDHRRSIVRAADAGWLVVDEVLLSGIRDSGFGIRGAHEASVHWHFHPSWMIRYDGNRRLCAVHLDGDHAWLLFDGDEATLLHGDEKSGLGWFAPVYGTLLPTWMARVTQTSRLPFSMVTWIGDAAGAVPPSLERVTVSADPEGEAIAARVTNDGATSLYLVRPGESPTRDSRACGVLEYQTNARMLHLRTRGDSLMALDLVDASHALALRDGWLSVTANEPMRDLHAALVDGSLHLAATEPPSQLHIEGSAVAGLKEIRLNGRSYPRVRGDRPDTLLLFRGDWTLLPLVHSGAQFALDEVRPEGCEEISLLRESSW